MSRLMKGEQAPGFSVTDIDNNKLKLENYQGKHLLLSLYRYASCPFCNLRINQMMNRYDKFNAGGLEIVAVFQSPKEKILKYVGKQHPPFAIVPDPKRELYSAYRLESSWSGFFYGMIFKMGDAMRAFSNGFTPGSMEGNINQLPADFLIGPDGIIIEAYYGADIGDHMPFETIEKVLNSQHTVSQ